MIRFPAAPNRAPGMLSLVRLAGPAGMLRKGVIRFTVTLAFATPKSSRWQALTIPGGWRQMHGQSAPVQGQAGPS